MRWPAPRSRRRFSRSERKYFRAREKDFRQTQHDRQSKLRARGPVELTVRSVYFPEELAVDKFKARQVSVVSAAVIATFSHLLASPGGSLHATARISKCEAERNVKLRTRNVPAYPHSPRTIPFGCGERARA